MANIVNNKRKGDEFIFKIDFMPQNSMNNEYGGFE